VFRLTLNSSYLLPREALTGLSPSLAPLSRRVQRFSHNLLFCVGFLFFIKKRKPTQNKRSVFSVFLVFFTSCFLCFLHRKKHKKQDVRDKKKRAKGKKRPCPLSLTTTYGISVDFFSFSYVDVSIH